MPELIKKILLLVASIVAAVVMMEPLLRLKFRDTAYVPGTTIVETQSYMQLQPELGFTWKKEVDSGSNVLLPWKDQEVEPLSTGPYGFANPPDAIHALKNGQAVDIIGIGDSFMHVASPYLHEYFKQHGLFYYSMAMPRYCPPQYTIVLDKYALRYKPRWIVYGLYENDFEETPDFENWKKSHLDWFTYHSGSWGGPPIAPNREVRFVRTHLRGFYAMYRAVRQMTKHAAVMAAKGYDPLMNVGVSVEKKQVRDVYRYVRKAHELAESHQISFVLLIIPSRAMVESGTTFKSRLYDELLKMARRDGIDVVDLRESFSRTSDPTELYYNVDSHWNRRGCVLAGEQIFKNIGQGGSSMKASFRH